MAYCTIQDIRDQTEKLESTTDVPDPMIQKAISGAERDVKAALGSKLTPAEVDNAGNHGSNVIKSLALFKATERTLVRKYGAKRKAEDVSDIDYWKSEYEKLLKKVLGGDIPIDIPDASIASVSKNYPALSGKTTGRKYPRKGIPGFTPSGGSSTYTDDNVT